MERQKRRLAAIVAVDVVGYSHLMGRDESGTLASLKEHFGMRLEPIVAFHDGRIVKRTGDGALLEFASAVDAVSAAITLQQRMAEANRGRAVDGVLQFRIGSHLCDVIVDGDDLYGDGVNVTARLEAEAPPGGILVSIDLHNAVVGRLKATFDDQGGLKLKNIDRPVRAYRVRWVDVDWPPTTEPLAAQSEERYPKKERSAPTGKVEWTWGYGSPLIDSRSSKEPLWIDGFYIKGRNISADHLRARRAYVRSDVNANVQELSFEVHGSPVPVNGVIVPPDANFGLTAFLPTTDPKRTHGMFADRFRGDFSRFTVFFEHDQGTERRQFLLPEIDELIQMAERRTRETLDRVSRREPTVIVPSAAEALVPLVQAAREVISALAGYPIRNDWESLYQDQSDSMLVVVMNTIREKAVLKGIFHQGNAYEDIKIRKQASSVQIGPTGAAIVRMNGEQFALYTDVAVTRADLGTFIEWAKAHPGIGA